MADTLFTPLAARLLACWEGQLLTLPAGEQPQRIGFRFDADSPTMGIALGEDECKCGSAWVKVNDWYATSDATFPGPDESLDGQMCPSAYALVLELGIGRCPPQGDENQLPTVADRNAFHLVVLQDVQLMRKAINCCFRNVPLPEPFVVGDWSKQGPIGMCFTQALTITIMVVNCNEC